MPSIQVLDEYLFLFRKGLVRKGWSKLNFLINKYSLNNWMVMEFLFGIYFDYLWI